MSEELGDYMFVPRGSVIETDKHMNEIYSTIDALRKQLDEWEEKEAACCPEDFGFEEVIKSLRKQLEELQKGNNNLISSTKYLQDLGRRYKSDNDTLQAKLDIAVEGLKHYKSSDMHWNVSPQFADDALAEIEKVKDE
jgi:polyhydroxyalkanoate synthesis regulator phasin